MFLTLLSATFIVARHRAEGWGRIVRGEGVPTL